MRALRLHGPHDLRLHEEEDPVPQEGELLVQVTAVGLCGSDRHWLVEGEIGDASLERPLVLGHELCGIVASGDGTGRRIALDPALPCEHCPTCHAGRQHLCPHQRFAGHGTTDGGLRSLLTWPEHLTVELPSTISDAEGALLEPLGVALHALDLGQVRPGTTAAVLGCGPIGLLLVQALAAAGVEVVLATDPLGHRRAAAARLGVGAALDAGQLGEVRLPDGLGVDVAFEAAGEDGALADAIAAVRPGGRVVLVGIPDGDHTGFVASPARRKGLSLLLSRRMRPGDLARAARLAASGRVQLAPLVSERHPLAAFEPAFEALATRRGLKVVVEPRSADPAGPR